ncbi:DAK2 domain-containing protein [Bacillus ginsengihumi]|uniref:DAK2 domain-containing protein n=2 Tax=Heyndrickxia ginsengihumi TaxID=363870 RepID=A0A6M0P4D2_9BACI|nr:DAK2 domain-containing protein [Heyndrickxia ginsengihumi]NEY19574.1 DAK2 domain-containing protein [Heyndrickxia ginsengihumi]
MVIQGANHLATNAQVVDALNVFPVPDGDTGTNMNLTMTSGAQEVKSHIQDHIGALSVSFAKGLLMGARGNSGVILSQLFRGFSKSIENKAAITSTEFADAFQAGIESAFKAIMKPVEGTILTVAREAAKKGVQVARKEKDITVVMEAILLEAQKTLNRTPEMLPVLKEVGVVDSGGQGLVFIYEGFLAELKGEELPDNPTAIPTMNELVSAEHHKHAQSFMNTADIKFGYCTEIMVRLEEEKLTKHPFSEEQFRQDLSQYGDSLLVIADDDIVKVHVHSEQPGAVLSYGQQYGSLIKIKIENMREQHSSIVGSETQHELVMEKKTREKKSYGIVAIAMGEGIAELFRSIGADAVIEGGQTMNPSTEDILNAIKEVNAEKIMILPNNKNIVMASEQAAEMADGEIVVIPSKTVPQGMAALLAFNPSATLEKNKQAMFAALQHVKSGQVTYAVRDTNIEGIAINKDDYMGIFEGKIVETSSDLLTASKQLIDKMIDEDDEIITIIYGQDATSEQVDELVTYIEQEYDEIEVEVHSGKQPLYSFIFAIE